MKHRLLTFAFIPFMAFLSPTVFSAELAAAGVTIPAGTQAATVASGAASASTPSALGSAVALFLHAAGGTTTSTSTSTSTSTTTTTSGR